MAATAGVRHSYAGGVTGVMYTDRRNFFLKPTQVADLYPDITPFYTFVSKLKTEIKPDDPWFKCFEIRPTWRNMDFFIRAAVDWNTASYEGTKANLTVSLSASDFIDVGFLQKGDIVEVRAGSTSVRDKGTETSGGVTTVLQNQVIARLLITSVDNQQQIDVENMSLAGGDTYNLVDGDYARVITHADPEGSDSNDGWTDEMVTVWGSTQIIKTPYTVTGTVKNMVLRGAASEYELKRDLAFKEHKMKLNGAFLKGYLIGASTSSRATAPTEFTNPNTNDISHGNAIRTTWGIIPLLQTYGTPDTNVFTRTWATYSLDNFIDDMTQRAQYFANDMVEYAFAGDKVLAELSKTGSDSFFARSGASIQLGKWEDDISFGFRIRRLTHPFGEMRIVRDPAMSTAPYNQMMVVVDPDNIGRVVFEQTQFQQAIQDPDYHGQKDQWLSDEGLLCTLIEKHCLFDWNG